MYRICSKNGPTTKYIILGLYIVYVCIVSYINFTRLTYIVIIIKTHLMRIRLPNFPKHNKYAYGTISFIIFWHSESTQLSDVLPLTSF